MATIPESARTSAVVSDERLRNALRLQLDRAINIDRSFTRAELETASGVNIHTIDGILSRDPAKRRRVAAEDLMSLMWALGENAVNAMLATIRYGGATSLDEQDERQPIAAAAECIKHFAVFIEAAKDNRIDHLEEVPVAGAADGIIAEMIPYSSARGGK